MVAPEQRKMEREVQQLLKSMLKQQQQQQQQKVGPSQYNLSTRIIIMLKIKYSQVVKLVLVKVH